MVKMRTEGEISSEYGKTWDSSEGMSGGKLCPCDSMLYVAKAPFPALESAEIEEGQKGGENGT